MELYVPLTAAVTAKKWDGKTDTMRYIDLMARFAGGGAGIAQGGQLRISGRDQRDVMLVAPGRWVIIGGQGGFTTCSEDEFAERYIKLPQED